MIDIAVIENGGSATALEQSSVSIRSACTKSDFKQKLKTFYSARHFVRTVSLYLDFDMVILQTTFLIADCK